MVIVSLDIKLNERESQLYFKTFSQTVSIKVKNVLELARLTDGKCYLSDRQQNRLIDNYQIRIYPAITSISPTAETKIIKLFAEEGYKKAIQQGQAEVEINVLDYIDNIKQILDEAEKYQERCKVAEALSKELGNKLKKKEYELVYADLTFSSEGDKVKVCAKFFSKELNMYLNTVLITVDVDEVNKLEEYLNEQAVKAEKAFLESIIKLYKELNNDYNDLASKFKVLKKIIRKTFTEEELDQLEQEIEEEGKKLTREEIQFIREII